MTMLNRLAAFLEPPRRVLLTTHENPDGDGTGSMVALAHFLRKMGSEVRIVVNPFLPHFLTWLDTEQWVESFDPEGIHADLAMWPEVWILVDASEPHRLGKMLPAFEASKALKICIDHHMKDAPMGFDQEFTDRTASASAELVFDLAEGRLPHPWPQGMAQALYAGLVDDTGNFRHSNSTPKVHRAAARLLELGAEAAPTFQNLYFQGRPERLKVFGRAYASLNLLGEGRFGTLCLTRADFAETGAQHDDLDNLVNAPLELRGVEVSALLYEQEDGRIKVSLRSKGRVDVNAVCRQFGGGGHRLASGARLEGPLSSALQLLSHTVLQQLEALNAPSH